MRSPICVVAPIHARLVYQFYHSHDLSLLICTLYTYIPSAVLNDKGKTKYFECITLNLILVLFQCISTGIIISYNSIFWKIKICIPFYPHICSKIRYLELWPLPLFSEFETELNYFFKLLIFNVLFYIKNWLIKSELKFHF